MMIGVVAQLVELYAQGPGFNCHYLEFSNPEEICMPVLVMVENSVK